MDAPQLLGFRVPQNGTRHECSRLAPHMLMEWSVPQHDVEKWTGYRDTKKGNQATNSDVCALFVASVDAHMSVETHLPLATDCEHKPHFAVEAEAVDLSISTIGSGGSIRGMVLQPAYGVGFEGGRLKCATAVCVDELLGVKDVPRFKLGPHRSLEEKQSSEVRVLPKELQKGIIPKNLRRGSNQGEVLSGLQKGACQSVSAYATIQINGLTVPSNCEGAIHSLPSSVSKGLFKRAFGCQSNCGEFSKFERVKDILDTIKERNDINKQHSTSSPSVSPTDADLFLQNGIDCQVSGTDRRFLPRDVISDVITTWVMKECKYEVGHPACQCADEDSCDCNCRFSRLAQALLQSAWSFPATLGTLQVGISGNVDTDAMLRAFGSQTIDEVQWQPIVLHPDPRSFSALVQAYEDIVARSKICPVILPGVVLLGDVGDSGDETISICHFDSEAHPRCKQAAQQRTELVNWLEQQEAKGGKQCAHSKEFFSEDEELCLVKTTVPSGPAATYLFKWNFDADAIAILAVDVQAMGNGIVDIFKKFGLSPRPPVIYFHSFNQTPTDFAAVLTELGYTLYPQAGNNDLLAVQLPPGVDRPLSVIEASDLDHKAEIVEEGVRNGADQLATEDSEPKKKKKKKVFYMGKKGQPRARRN